jgi:hypothetical protein
MTLLLTQDGQDATTSKGKMIEMRISCIRVEGDKNKGGGRKTPKKEQAATILDTKTKPFPPSQHYSICTELHPPNPHLQTNGFVVHDIKNGRTKKTPGRGALRNSLSKKRGDVKETRGQECGTMGVDEERFGRVLSGKKTGGWGGFGILGEALRHHRSRPCRTL